MNVRVLWATLSLVIAVSGAEAHADMISFESPDSVAETTDNLVAALEERDLKVFARIDHAAGARQIGEDLRPTQLVIFGNPKMGTPLIQCSQTVAVDLPMKALIWEDAEGVVRLGFADPVVIAESHETGECGGVAGRIAENLNKLGAAVTAQ